MKFSIEFDWEPIGQVILDAAGKLAFPSLRIEPGVYRFRMVDTPASAVYIGESLSLRQRAGNYRNPGPSQKTSLRINARFLEHLRAGGRIEMSIARNVRIELNGLGLEQTLAYAPQRLVVESLGLIAADAEGFDHIENL